VNVAETWTDATARVGDWESKFGQRTQPQPMREETPTTSGLADLTAGS